VRGRVAYGAAMTASGADPSVSSRARAWRDSAHVEICDVLEPWAYGTVRRATQYPGYFEFNSVTVTQDPAMSVEDLVAFADHALADVAHRRIDFDLVTVGERHRAGFDALGWKTMRLLWMHHEAPPAPAPDVTVEQVEYDSVYDLRAAWHREDFPADDFAAHYPDAREVARRRQAQVLAVREGDRPVAFTQIERNAHNSEITQVYVHPDLRGGGRGTAMTRAAIMASRDADDLWIVADDEDRPKQLYCRLGFRPAWTTMEFLRLPTPRS
jgi:GNAT superfamily N-acetyltransferase